MSFRSTSKPSSSARRSSSFRSSNSNTTVPGLASYNRPRSLNLFSTSTPTISSYSGYTSSPTFHSYLGSSNSPSFSNSYNYNAFNPYSKYSNGYGNNYSSNYGGTTTGYGGISLPSKTLSALNIMPSYASTKNYERNYEGVNRNLKSDRSTNTVATPTTTSTNEKERQRKSRSTNRNGSFNRSRSHSAIRDSGMGSRSVSLTSLNSEGYASGSEKSSRSSRLGSASDLAALRGENGELDYKKMYEQAISENDRLRDKLRKSDEDLRETKQTLEKLNTVTSKNSLSELEKRERRAMERKLSEMEEELKQLQKLKAENERLRAENRALTRVVSKLTNSTGK